MNRDSNFQAHDLQRLVCHTTAIEASVAIEALVALSQRSRARYFAVLEAGRPVGLIPRDDGPRAPQPDWPLGSEAGTSEPT